MESITELLQSAQPACSGSLAAVEELIASSEALAVQAAQQTAAALKTLQTVTAGCQDDRLKLLKKQLRDLLLWRIFGLQGGMLIDSGARQKELVLACLCRNDICDPFKTSVDETLSQLVQAHGKIQQNLLKQLICSSNWSVVLKDINRKPEELDNAGALQILEAYVQNKVDAETPPCRNTPKSESPTSSLDSTDDQGSHLTSRHMIKDTMPKPVTLRTFLHFPDACKENAGSARRRCSSEGPETRRPHTEFLQEVSEEKKSAPATEQVSSGQSQTLQCQLVAAANPNGFAEEAWFQLSKQNGSVHWVGTTYPFAVGAVMYAEQLCSLGSSNSDFWAV